MFKTLSNISLSFIVEYKNLKHAQPVLLYSPFITL